MYIKKIQIRIDRRILPNRHRQDINPPVGEPNTPVSKYSGKTSLTQACICYLHTHSKTPAFFLGWSSSSSSCFFRCGAWLISGTWDILFPCCWLSSRPLYFLLSDNDWENIYCSFAFLRFPS